MAQITSGIRAVLSNPFFYNAFQNIMGATALRKYFISNLIRPTTKMKILDIGCGTAEILKFLPENVEYTGYDPSEEYIIAAKKSFPKRGEFHQGYFDEIAANNYINTFDAAICIGVLHHLDDPEANLLLTNVKKTLKTSGKFCSIDPVFIKNQNIFANLIIKNDRGKNIRFPNEYSELSNKQFHNVKVEIRHRNFIPYTHCLMECFD